MQPLIAVVDALYLKAAVTHASVIRGFLQSKVVFCCVLTVVLQDMRPRGIIFGVRRLDGVKWNVTYSRVEQLNLNQLKTSLSSHLPSSRVTGQISGAKLCIHMIT